ncbi:MAG: DUF6348 family protein [Polyangiaceae bacterium]
MNLTQLVDAFFDAIERLPTVRDGEVELQLIEAGAEPRTAGRIVAFAPIAAARTFYQDEGPKFTGSFGWQSEGGPAAADGELADEPEFVEALLAARRSSDLRLLAVVRRSSTYKAVQQLLGDSPDPERVKQLMIGKALFPAELRREPGTPAPRWTTSNTGTLALLAPESNAGTEELSAQLQSIDVDVTPQATPPRWQFWRSASQSLVPRVRAYISHPKPDHAELSLKFELTSPQGVVLDELQSSGEDVTGALAEGLELFQETALPAIVAALVDEKKAPGEYFWVRGKRWHCCHGQLRVRGIDSPPAPFAWPQLLERFEATDASAGPHSVRWSTTPSSVELRLDGKPWGEGRSLLPPSGNGNSVHQFALFVPAR